MGNCKRVSRGRKVVLPREWIAMIAILVLIAAITGPAITQEGETTDREAHDGLLAYWSFDRYDGQTLYDSGPFGMHAQPSADRRGTIQSAPGVAGSAVHLSGTHLVRCGPHPVWEQLSQITLCAWVSPEALSAYREIFRKEDGDRRVLFSFQHDGRILSLGLHIDGYVECDAPLRPEDVLDGFWHFCAATYDGQFMRVFFDGRKIGELERSGKLQAGGSAPGCIGSLNGGENFQGRIDELRIYARALSDRELAEIYQAGLKSILAQQEQAADLARQVYVRHADFAQTVAAIRNQLASLPPETRAVAAPVLTQLLRAEFPDDCARLAEYTHWTLHAYLSGAEEGMVRRTAQLLCELLTEYRPITESQWAKLSAAERNRWEKLDELAAECRRLIEEQIPEDSPAWITWILAAGPQIQFRPRIHEAVAPYVSPRTPPTRTLSPAEAQEALERDWLFQADGHPTVRRTREEIGWTEELIRRLEAMPRAPSLEDLSRQLAVLKSRVANLPLEHEDRELYFEVRKIKRQVMFRNPLIDFDRLVFIDQPFPQGSEWNHETRHRLGYMAVPGGRLLVLEGLHPGGKLRQLAPQGALHGSFWRPDLDFDAQHVAFCFKPHNEKSFHLFEVGIDSSGLVQLTDGPYDDLDPIYLPDGKHLIFTTTRGHSYVRCMPPTNAFVLARCDRSGKNICLISANNEPDYLPSVMPDGRILYTRWEYTDKPVWRAQGLWTVHPNGTQVQVLWGNQSVWPDLLKDARVIPGSNRILFTGSAHHDWFAGCLGILDPEEGFNYPDGLRKITWELPWPESGDGPHERPASPRYHPSGRYLAYYSPYPLGEYDFLVSADRGGKFVLYIMDLDGNRELIYEGTHNIWYAQPLQPRPRPPVLPDLVQWPTRENRDAPDPGIIYSGDVYQNAPESLRGKARFLRVWTIDHKTYTYWYQRPYVSTGPVVSAVQSDGVKRLIGTVPIEADGSVCFYAPPGIPLHFQLLDAEHRALQTMRSFVHVMPGEKRGCMGCHEAHSRAPISERYAGDMFRQPHEITPPPWQDRTVSYPRYVQPVLDKYCGPCHQGTGEAVKVLDLTPRPGFLGFAEPYFLLTGWPTWGTPYQRPPVVPPGFGIANMLMVEGYDQRDPAAYKTPVPMTALSYKSPLVEICSGGEHYGVKVDEISRLRIIAWIDAMCPYQGEEEIRSIPDPEFQGIDWLAIRPRIATAPVVVRPGPLD